MVQMVDLTALRLGMRTLLLWHINNKDKLLTRSTVGNPIIYITSRGRAYWESYQRIFPMVDHKCEELQSYVNPDVSKCIYKQLATLVISTNMQGSV